MEHRPLHPKSSIGSFQVPISPKQPINLPTTSTSYLAVILAGPGEGLFPLINNQPIDSDEPPLDQSSKAALPLLNRPIIEFTLEWIDQSGLTDILILASESQRTALNSIIRTRKINTTTTTQTIKVEFIPDLEFLNHGTSGSLRWAIQRNLIKTAFVVLPCDLYFQRSSRTDPSSSLKCSQVDQIHDRKLISIVERHRTHQNLITSVFYERQANTLDLRDGPALNLVTLDPRSGTLLNLQELDGFGSTMEIRMKMIDKCPTSVLSSSLVPAHVFVCSPAVIDLLIGLPQLASFKHQFVPWLAKNQWQPGLLKKTALASTKLDLPSDPLTEALLRSSTNPRPSSNRHETVIKGHRTPLTATSTPPMSRNFSYLSLDARVEQFSHQSLSHGTLKSAFDKAAPIKEDSITPFRCEYVLWIADDGFVCRANSVPGYAEINRTALKLDHERVQERNQTRPSGPPVPGTGTAGADSLLGSNVVLADKSSVKKSIVGKNCSIGKSSKILNSILMEKVSIGEHVKIENCILTNNVVIGDRVELKDCEVEAGTVIEADFITKGEKIARC
ncbi:hypothetical protein MJO28_002064 [Puccinia striiformis f. sp. tritici]|uniref:Uncharacterized protein n=1 Tax=Puccinia striiformis f. sp. tritici TaxID=168172 RepID=A0ACC0EVB0_9BASI|nr:hypothetical protein MJO28_002064 [Puccinia striiformis f. sp. tritici]